LWGALSLFGNATAAMGGRIFWLAAIFDFENCRLFVNIKEGEKQDHFIFGCFNSRVGF
jgi:hypothetical protein